MRSGARDRTGAADRRRARLVTYGAVAVLLACAAASLEPWPVSSFRLFSERRTGDRTVLVLVAVDADGARTPVRLGPDPRVVRAAQRQLPHLADLPPAEQRRKARAFLDLADVDPDGVAVVVLQRVRRRLDPAGGPPTERARTDVVQIPLR